MSVYLPVCSFGFFSVCAETPLNMQYKSRFNMHIPDAYVRLIYEALIGDQRNFIREDELDVCPCVSMPFCDSCSLPYVRREWHFPATEVLWSLTTVVFLQEAWKIFTPVLQDLEREQIEPDRYPFGSRGPVEAEYLAAK